MVAPAGWNWSARSGMTAGTTFKGMLRAAAFGVAVSASQLAFAAPETGPIKVGLYLSAPFAMSAQGRPTGMAVDLWTSVAARLGRQSTFVIKSSLPELLKATADGTVDVAVSNLTVTADRSQKLDFTQPWYDAGLRIMIQQERELGAWELLHDLNRLGYLASYAWLGGLIAAITVVLTLIERRIDMEFPREWSHGLAQSLHHVMSVATSGRTTHKNLFGSLGTAFAALWMVCGVAVVAYVTSTVTTVMTRNAIVRHIGSLADLPGKRIGVEAGSAAEDYIRAVSLDARPYDTQDAAVTALLSREVDAVVGDAANLEYFDATHRSLPVTQVGRIFDTSKYAFALPPGSRLTRDITVQLLALQEDGTVDKLRSRYFAVAP
ncbi:transporter substrate-binding domain-containing protein [Lichenifustis flavocetrariae]|uniref:Transporter substrate-binding domain-containing protein n=1 Tax=Lichenifustis flavocetrariae TaxID=2949735 RepID=A0AA41Z3R0_9HYPH|nr:transporter substrate-binding domain-containing protein [Lichenifustis flavocetrariae]MCW6512461.1 transporter substrate-binding domain-containing protein [Lichenifustis flavocetrariae]